MCGVASGQRRSLADNNMGNEQKATSPLMHQDVLRSPMSSPALPTDAAARCSEGKPEGTSDLRSAANADRTQHPTEREKVNGSSSRKRDGGSCAVAESKGGEEALAGNGGDGDERGAGRGLASLGDLPSLGRKMVSHVELFHRGSCLSRGNEELGAVLICRILRHYPLILPLLARVSQR